MSDSERLEQKRMRRRKAKQTRRERLAPTHNLPTAQPIPANVVTTPQDLIKLACKLSLTSGYFIDTKFYAYSRRAASGKVYKPRAVYANSYILRVKASHYFEPLLQGGYDGYCVTGPLHGDFPSTFPAEHEEGGYESDSDLEDDEDDSVTGAHDTKGTSTSATSGSSWARVAPSASKEEKGKDIAHEELRDAKIDAEKEDDDADDEDEDGHNTIRLVRNFAYPTWNAFVYYLYTGEVDFAPLKSQPQKPKPTAAGQKDAIIAVSPLCSPKSMYRLAHELGLEDLMKQAKDDIQTKLSADNILTELFSTFTSKYDEIKDMEIEYACQNAKDAVTKGIYEWMQNMSPEALKRSVGVVASLIQNLGGSSALAQSQSALTYNTGNNQLICRSCGSQWRYFRCSSCNNNWRP